MAQEALQDLRDFHARLSKRVNVGEFDNFQTAMGDSIRREEWYGKMSGHVDMGDLESFHDKMDTYTAPVQPKQSQFLGGIPNEFATGVKEFVAGVPGVAGQLLKEIGTPSTPDGFTMQRQIIPPESKLGQLDTKINEKLVGAGEKLISDTNVRMERMFKAPETETKRFIRGLGSGAGSMLAALTVSAITRSPKAAASLFGLMAKGRAYGEAIESGKSVEEASSISTKVGISEGILENIGLGILLKRFKGPIKGLLIKATSEAMQEGAQSLSEAGILTTSGVREFQGLTPIFRQAAEEALMGAILGGGASVAISVLRGELISRGASEEQADKIVGDMKEKVSDNVTKIVGDASKTATLSEEAVSEISRGISPIQERAEGQLEEEVVEAEEELMPSTIEEAPIKGRFADVARTVGEEVEADREETELGPAISKTRFLAENGMGNIRPMTKGEMGGEPNHIMFDDPITRTSLEMHESNVTEAGLREHLIRSYEKDWTDKDKTIVEARKGIGVDNTYDKVAEISKMLGIPIEVVDSIKTPKGVSKRASSNGVRVRMTREGMNPYTLGHEIGEIVQRRNESIQIPMGQVDWKGLNKVRRHIDKKTNRRSPTYPKSLYGIKEAVSDFVGVMYTNPELAARLSPSTMKFVEGSLLLDRTIDNATKARMAELIAMRPVITPVIEDVEGIKESPNAKSLRNSLWELVRGKRISKSILYKALEEGVGIKDLKFKGPGAVTKEQLSELMDRMRRVDSHWPDSDKEFFLLHGDLPLPDYGVSGPLMTGHGGIIVNAARMFTKNIAQSIETSLQKMGDIGDAINKRGITQRWYANALEAKLMAAAKRAFKHFNSKDWKEYINRRESGDWDDASDKLQEADRIMGTQLGAIDGLAKMLGFRVRSTKSSIKDYEGLGTKFWPHSFDYDWTRSEKKRKALMSYWMKRKGISEEEVNIQMGYLAKQRQSNLSVHLEWARDYNAPGWLGDPGSPDFSSRKARSGLDMYIKDVSTRISDMMWFDTGGRKVHGKDWKTVSELVNSEKDNDKRLYLSKLVTRMRGLDPQAVERAFFAELRNIQIVRLLGMASIPNAFQPHITIVPKVMTFGYRNGLRIMYKGIKEAIHNPSFAIEEVGAAMDQNMREVVGLSSRGVTRKAATMFLKGLGFSAEENAWNILAASVGKPYIKKVFSIAKGESVRKAFGIYKAGPSARHQTLAIRELKMLGISEDILKKDTLDDTTIEMASWNLARLTQFRGHAQDLPYLWSSDYGKLLSQFKTFSFNINKLWWHHMAKPAISWVGSHARHPFEPSKWRGTIAPLLAFEAGSILSGEIIAYIRGTLIWGRERPENLFLRLLDDHMWAGTLGLVHDLFYAAQSSSLLSSMAGPSVGMVVEILEAVLGKRKVSTMLKKQIPILRSTPFLDKKEDVY